MASPAGYSGSDPMYIHVRYRPCCPALPVLCKVTGPPTHFRYSRGFLVLLNPFNYGVQHLPG